MSYSLHLQDRRDFDCWVFRVLRWVFGISGSGGSAEEEQRISQRWRGGGLGRKSGEGLHRSFHWETRCCPIAPLFWSAYLTSSGPSGWAPACPLMASGDPRPQPRRKQAGDRGKVGGGLPGRAPLPWIPRWASSCIASPAECSSMEPATWPRCLRSRAGKGSTRMP